MRALRLLLLLVGMAALAGCSAEHGDSPGPTTTEASTTTSTVAATTTTTVPIVLWLEAAEGDEGGLEISFGTMHGQVQLSSGLTSGITLPESLTEELSIDCPGFRSAYTNAAQVEAAPVAELALDWAAFVHSFTALNTLCTNGGSQAAFESTVDSTYTASNAALAHFNNDETAHGLPAIPGGS